MSLTQRQIRADRRLMKFYNQRARQWGEQYMKRHWWRIQAMYDIEDIRQDAFSCYLRVYRQYSDLDEPDIYRIYKRAMWGRITTRSKQCFPNSYAYVAEQGKLVLEFNGDLTQEGATGDIESFLVQWSDVITQLPNELVDVLRLLTRDFLGVECIEQRRRKRLKGKIRVEPLNMSIARALGMGPTRDFLSELATLLDDRVYK